MPPTLASSGGFVLFDWVVLCAYGVLLAVTGWLFSRRASKNTSDFFLGAHSMPVWAVVISVVATSLSAATFIGGPQQSYAGNLTYLSSNIGMVLAAVLVATLLLPKLYAKNLATPYGLLEERFGTTGRMATSAAFLLGRVMASGARVFIVGIPAALLMFGEPAADAAIPAWQIVSAIVAITVVGVAYTLAGGVRSVIWTDVVQMCMFVVAIGAAILLLLDRVPGGFETVWGALRETGADDPADSKLTVIDTSFNLTEPYTLLACLTAFVLMGTASYGLDQDMVQRMLTCKSSVRGAWSVISATLAAIPTVALFMIVGLLLFVFYERPDLMGAEAPGYEPYDSSRIFLSFILRELPPGLGGLMMAGLFAAGLSSLNSGLNSMSSAVVNDFYTSIAPDKSDRHYLAVGRALVVFWAVVLGGFACLCVFWYQSESGTLIDFALGVMTFAYAGLIGVFFSALLTRRGNGVSAIAALVVGFGAVLIMNQPAWSLVLGPERISDLEHASAGDGAVARTIAWLWSLAFPWKLTLASVCAFVVCQLGASQKAR